MKKISLIASMSLLGLLGCSSPAVVTNEVQQSHLQSTNQVSDILWNEVNVPSVFSFSFSGKTQRFESELINSPVAGFALNNVGKSIEIELSAPISDGVFFAPSLALYDENLRLIRNFDSSYFTYDRNDFIAGEVIEGVVEISLPLNITKFYAVIYTTEEDVDGTTTVIHPAKAMAIAKRNEPPRIADPVVEHSWNGQVNVEVSYKSSFNPFVKETKPAAISNVPSASETQIAVKPLDDTKDYYFNAIQSAVEANELNKALALLEEAKALNIEGAQEVFIKAVNAK
ncbi:MalM family protein [Vibrio maerlii]|uniref:MalM family protein n=1 Tax=Vibrio maerlii TaxID=2231648 RepID=UPI000E3E0483|nr:MalM family protein [Vibrio maerlii]